MSCETPSLYCLLPELSRPSAKSLVISEFGVTHSLELVTTVIGGGQEGAPPPPLGKGSY